MTLNAGSGTLLVNGGTGAITIQNAGTGAINVANNAVNSVVNIGKTGAATNTTTLNLATASGGAQGINIGGTGGAGNSNSGTVVTIQGGASQISVANGGLSLTGNVSQSGGTVSMAANGASSFTTSSGALTLTSAAAATWSTTSGNLTIQAGGGTVSLGSSTQLTANGNLTVASAASNTLTLQGGTGGTLITADGTGNTGVTVKTTTSSTAAFQVQNSSGSAILVVDGTNRQLKIFENAGTTNYALIYFDTATSTANYTASAGTVAVGRGAGAITVTAGTGAAVNITANAASTWKTTAGTLTLQSGTGATDYLILNSNGSGQVQVNGTSVLKLGSATSDPTCTNGAIFYNTTTNHFRGCENGTWANLDTITPTLQNTYTASTGGTTPEIKLDSTRGGVDIQDADTTIGGVLFAVRGSNAAGLGTALFNVTNASGSNIVQIGSSTGHSTGPVVLGLDNYANSGADPAGFNGAMYYNGTNNKFRCYENGTWVDCVNGPSQNVTTFNGTWAATAAKSAANIIYITPIYITGQLTVNEIRVDVTTALGAAGDIGIYDSNGNLVINGGNSSLTTTTGFKSITPAQSNKTLEAGQYYAAVTWNSTSGAVAGNTILSGQMKYTGTLATGGLVLPSTITISSITIGTVVPGITFNN